MQKLTRTSAGLPPKSTRPVIQPPIFKLLVDLFRAAGHDLNLILRKDNPKKVVNEDEIIFGPDGEILRFPRCLDKLERPDEEGAVFPA